MSAFFSNPFLLLFAPVCALIFWRWRRRNPAAIASLQRRNDRRFWLQACAATSLILAAAGFQIPSRGQHHTIVIATDVSDSVFDLSTQRARLNEMMSALDLEKTDAAVVVFGANAGLERPLAPINVPQQKKDKAEKRAKVEPLIPDLTRIGAVVDKSSTDLGQALQFARGQIPTTDAKNARAILLLSDFRNTRGVPDTAFAALEGSGIDLLVTPAALGVSSDVHLASLRVPETIQVGRALPIEVTVAAPSACNVRVSVWRDKAGGEPAFVDSKTVVFTPEAGATAQEVRRTVTIIDHPENPGAVVYSAKISGAEGPLPNDINLNNQLSAATRVIGPSRWAVLTRSGSTLDQIASDKSKGLGVETTVFRLPALPERADAYERYAGIIVDGFSKTELPEGAALRAICDAAENGKALLAIGGTQAFGAGGHREGLWESVLPVEMTPEDDRTRSILFLIDVSKSMEQRMGRGGSGVRKIDFAAEQLGQAVQKLKPLDRLALITFSGVAQVAAPLSSDPSRTAFLNAVKNINIVANTDILEALKKAQEVLKKDDAEEQLVVLLSDGIQTVPTNNDDLINAAKALCPAPASAGSPRRTVLFSFGIGVDSGDTNDAGEKLMKALADASGGTYFPQFNELAKRLEQAFAAQKKDFYFRRELFAVRNSSREHPILFSVSGTNEAETVAWPVLNFRNRVKAKPGAEMLLSSASQNPSGESFRRPDPILVVSGNQWASTARRAALALSLDGEAGSALLKSDSGQRLLPAILEWAEAKKSGTPPGWSISTDFRDDDMIEVEVRIRDPRTQSPVNGKRLFASLNPLHLDAADASPSVNTLSKLMLHPSAPGVYRSLLPAPASGVYRFILQEEKQQVCERFVTVPFPSELRRFGTDRAAMQKFSALAGKTSRVIESPRDLAEWAAQKEESHENLSLRPALIVLGIALLLWEFALRGRSAA